MTRDTEARKGEGYTLNTKAANQKYEGETVIGLFPFHMYLIK